MAMAKVEGLHYLVIQTISLGLNSMKVVLAEIPLKWSCSKEEIMVQYAEIDDKFNTYINVYKTSSFDLLYAHRVMELNGGLTLIGGFNFPAELTCSGLLLVAHI